MENIQAPCIGKPEEEWEDPDGYFDAHADDGDLERENWLEKETKNEERRAEKEDC